MKAADFFSDIAARNYEEASRNPDCLRFVWNAVVSMNTAPEYVALERLNYREVPRSELDKAAGEVRQNHQFPRPQGLCGNVQACAKGEGSSQRTTGVYNNCEFDRDQCR
jgi:hypothetical protein